MHHSRSWILVLKLQIVLLMMLDTPRRVLLGNDYRRVDVSMFWIELLVPVLIPFRIGEPCARLCSFFYRSERKARREFGLPHFALLNLARMLSTRRITVSAQVRPGTSLVWARAAVFFLVACWGRAS